MNTPLMELIEWNNKELLEAKHVIDNAKDYDERTLAMADHYYRVHYQVKAKATELLEKEMELARHAFLNAINMGDDISPKTANELFEDYYTKTFTNESK